MTKTKRVGERLPYLLCQPKTPRVLERLEQTAERARAEQWPYEQFLEALLEAEVFAREASGARQRIRHAAFPAHKTLEDFDWTAQPAAERPLVMHLAQLARIEEHANVCFLGPPDLVSHCTSAVTVRQQRHHRLAVRGESHCRAWRTRERRCRCTRACQRGGLSRQRSRFSGAGTRSINRTTGRRRSRASRMQRHPIQRLAFSWWVSGSSDDGLFGPFRDALIRGSNLLAQYDALKRRLDGANCDRYTQRKAEFIERVLRAIERPDR